ncbi:MAG TPA: FtsH protease activity modulator HflK [Sphaerochaeta sp.]|jgi:membrane protease subunit HflK|nr:FtsH protease activity modulator HflK [Spirochaetota bacterium]HOR80592.1 FtsH protease activity modulator HflK [Sphaerochaeta sp.]HPB41341.1 FtsH protease activity modulator HflK [Sphaerochaeta sp.]HPK64334.1 FtsH protease activity modulator HflK [Sphaerochaeta sp.]HPY45724.1 FtsH protease activity modulator HflK [Sphaerochaeta sp.]
MDNRNQRPVRPIRFNISPKLVIWIVIAVVAILMVLGSFFVVDQTEQAVVLRFGRYHRTVGPGLQTKIPLGIERNYNVPTQVVQTMTFGYRGQGAASPLYGQNYTNESLMLTGDLNIIDVQWTVQYKIENPYNWMFKVESRESTLRDISQSIMNQLVGDLPILSVMTSQRTRIEVEAQEMMQKMFDLYGLGIRVVTVKLQNIVPPVGSVQDAFEDVNKAIQDMNRYINEGKKLYNEVIPAARGEANRLIQVANGYAAERVNQARGDVERFNSVREVYENSKDITRTRLYIETLEEILQDNNGKVTLVDKNLTNFLPMQMLQGGQP